MRNEDFLMIEQTLKISLPDFYKEMLLKKMYKKLKENKLYITAEQIIKHNLNLLENGYMGKKWPVKYFVIASERTNTYDLIDLKNKENEKIFCVIEEDQFKYKNIKKHKLSDSIKQYIINSNIVYGCR